VEKEILGGRREKKGHKGIEKRKGENGRLGKIKGKGFAQHHGSANC